MQSNLPKVLHTFCGEPLIFYPLAAARKLGTQRCVLVVGHGADEVKSTVDRQFSEGIQYVLQAEQRGTGHAVLCALDAISDHQGPVFILSGDVPLLRSSTLRSLGEACTSSSAGIALLTFTPESLVGYGRIIRDKDGAPIAIREDRDCTPEERSIRECNAGVYCVEAKHLRADLPAFGTNNDQGEIYLTDLVASRSRQGRVETLGTDSVEVAGINTMDQLHALERHARHRQVPPPGGSQGASAETQPKLRR